MIQLLGTASILVLAFSLYLAAHQTKSWCFYGRETAITIATYLMALFVIRLLRTNLDLITAKEAMLANAWILSVTACGQMMTLFLHWQSHRSEARIKKERQRPQHA